MNYKTFTTLVLFVAFTYVSTMGFNLADPTSDLTEAQNQKTQSKTNELEVEVIPDKTFYKPNDKIKLRVLLVNTGKNEIYLLNALSWGRSATLSLSVTDAGNKEINPKFLDDSILHLANEDIEFVRLSYQQILGTHYLTSVSELNITNPGKYFLSVEYHVPISSAEVKVKPFWGNEKETVRSTPIMVEVVR